MSEAGGQVRMASPPAPGQTGGRGYPAYRVIFNPRPNDLGIAPGYLASAHRREVPTTTVLDRPRRQATRDGRFRVPEKTPPGLYMVLIFDGEEGGAHNTWDYVHVVGRNEEARSERPTGAQGDAGTAGWPLLAGVAVACLFLGAAAAEARRRRV